jgi:hypothetical protein
MLRIAVDPNFKHSLALNQLAGKEQSFKYLYLMLFVLYKPLYNGSVVLVSIRLNMGYLLNIPYLA